MPLIKSAIKKMRQDKARTLRNRAKIDVLKKALKSVVTKPSSENLSQAFSQLDKAAKKGLIPKARADRKKSRLAKAIGTTVKILSSAKPKKVVSKKKKLS